MWYVCDERSPVARLAVDMSNLLHAPMILLLMKRMPALYACSTEGSKQKPPIYKVMLWNDNHNRREYVVKTLLRVVEKITVDDAVVVMQVCMRLFHVLRL